MSPDGCCSSAAPPRGLNSCTVISRHDGPPRFVTLSSSIFSPTVSFPVSFLDALKLDVPVARSHQRQSRSVIVLPTMSRANKPVDGITGNFSTRTTSFKSNRAKKNVKTVVSLLSFSLSVSLSLCLCLCPRLTTRHRAGKLASLFSSQFCPRSRE